MTKEERREYMRKRRAEHRAKFRESVMKWRAEHNDEYREYKKKRCAENKEEHRDYMKKYNTENLNKDGVKKSNIRNMSGRVLEKSHAKLPGYEIHHCFGYEDPGKFIYIPKSLHLQIHQLLRDNSISAEENHWKLIRKLVNSCEEYTYIRT